MRTPLLLRTPAILGVVASLAMTPVGAHAQGELVLELGGSQFGPPLGMEGDYARFLIGGVRASAYANGGSGVSGGMVFGRTLDSATGGSFLSGSLDATLLRRWTPTVSTALDTRVLGYGAQNPFPFRAFAVEGGPSLTVRTERFGLNVDALGGLGSSSIELRRFEDGPSRVFTSDLWRWGGSAEVAVGPVTSNLGLTAGWHRSPVGDYRSLGGRLVLAGGWGITELRVDRWRTPTTTEVTAGLALVIPVGRLWSVRGFFGRTDPDPLTLAQPGSTSGGLLVGRTLWSDEPDDGASPLYQVVRTGVEGSRVRFTVEAPSDASSVVVLGDFSLWAPLTMTREGGRWVAEVEVPAGTHHFGFLVDELWYVPDDAPDVVPDEWGRDTATLVIEGAGR